MTGANNAHSVRKLGQRAHRPAPLRRITTGSVISPKSSPGAASKKAHEKDPAEMATSFLNYCAMCEKQINVPNNSILYCSEACRRKDSVKPLSMSSAALPSPPTPPSTFESSTPRAVLPPLTPSSAPSVSTPQLRIPAEDHDYKSDLDPTEWKPKLGRPPLVSNKSAALVYLSQFHRSMTDGAVGETTGGESSTLRPGHRSTVSMNSIWSTPSLATSPVTAASSIDTDGLSPIAQSYTYGYGEYDFATRALPPRHNPYYSSSANVSRGLDLVTPHCPPEPPTVVENEPAFQGVLWEKRSWGNKGASTKATDGVGLGLGALFGKSGGHI